jgi:DNA repair protein RecO (recombination protein O)
MPARVSEAIVLQTYPLKESDLIVSFFTRDAGKLRGVAKRARRPKSMFGAGLERLSHVRMAYFERENRELVNLDSCDLLQSQFAVLSDYAAGVSLDYLAEVSEQIMPAHEPNEKFFRLLLSVLEHIRAGSLFSVWRAVTYFTLWAVKLAGLLPEMHGCLSCGSWLEDPETPERAFFRRGAFGLICGHCKRATGGGNTWELTPESRMLVREMLRKPVAEIDVDWNRQTASDLRRFLQKQIESHIERRLITAPVLEAA